MLPGKSLYNLQVSLTDQRGTALTFASFRGRPLLVTMFYASCTTICPMLIEQLRQTDDALSADLRAQTRVLLVSLDPEHDTVERLAELAKLHDIKSDRWHFTRSSASLVPEIAALLGISYRHLPDGTISHSASISLLDREGVLVMQQDGLRGDPMEVARALGRIAGPD
jgi:protein SCO1/2